MRPTFRAIATTIVPEAAELDEREWVEVEGLVENALAERPVGVRRQLVLFIRALGVLPVLRFGRTFRRLDLARRHRVLSALQHSPLFLVRRGFWGLRTLVFMGFYARPGASDAVGYRAHPRGWLDHPAAPAAARERARDDNAEI